LKVEKILLALLIVPTRSREEGKRGKLVELPLEQDCLVGPREPYEVVEKKEKGKNRGFLSQRWAVEWQ